MNLNLYQGATAAILKAPKQITADTYGPVVEITDYTGIARVDVIATHDSGATPTMTVSAYTATDSTDTFTAVSGASASFTGTNEVKSFALDLRACKTHIKLLFDITGAGTKYTVAATGVFIGRGY